MRLKALTTRLTTRCSQHSRVANTSNRYGDGAGIACVILIPENPDIFPSHIATGIATLVAHEQAEYVLEEATSSVMVVIDAMRDRISDLKVKYRKE